MAEKMGIQGQKYVQEFDSQRMVAQQEELYQRMLNAKC